MIDVIIPTLGRPQRLAEIVRNINAATVSDHRVVFVIEEHDTASAEAVEALGLEPVYNEQTENYAGAVNTAYGVSEAEYLFAAADDLVFHDGWDEHCLSHMDGWIKVVGTNDLLNPYVLNGSHATHYLVDRWYLDEVGGVVDSGPGSFLAECYDHNFTDTEFIGTAKMRARFHPCLEAIVEHLHPLAGKSEFDDTYQRSVRGFDDDEALYDLRRDLWFGLTR